MSPDSSVYKFVGETASITCVGAGSVDPHVINVRTPLPTGLSVGKLTVSVTVTLTVTLTVSVSVSVTLSVTVSLQ